MDAPAPTWNETALSAWAMREATRVVGVALGTWGVQDEDLTKAVAGLLVTLAAWAWSRWTTKRQLAAKPPGG